MAKFLGQDAHSLVRSNALMMGYEAFFQSQMVVLAEAFYIEKANPYLEYISFPARTK